jgi:prevent-host-death family protein
MSEPYSVEEANIALPALVQRVEDGSPVRITRQGKAVAVLLSIHEYEQIVGKRKDFWERLMDFRKEMETEGIEISDSDLSDLEGLRDSRPGRDPVFER